MQGTGGKKRKDILDAASRLFAERGYTSTSTALLAKEAKVAEGTIFRHFEGKEQIFYELIANLHQSVKRNFEEEVSRLNAPTALEYLIISIRSFIFYVHANSDDFTLFFRDAPARYQGMDKVFLEVQAIYEYIESFLAFHIEQGMQEGAIRPDTDSHSAAIIIGCSIIGFTRGMHFGLRNFDEQLCEQLLDSFRRILASS